MPYGGHVTVSQLVGEHLATTDGISAAGRLGATPIRHSCALHHPSPQSNPSLIPAASCEIAVRTCPTALQSCLRVLPSLSKLLAMAFGIGRGMTAPLMVINFILYFISACLAGSLLNRTLDGRGVGELAIHQMIHCFSVGSSTLCFPVWV